MTMKYVYTCNGNIIRVTPLNFELGLQICQQDTKTMYMRSYNGISINLCTYMRIQFISLYQPCIDDLLL